MQAKAFDDAIRTKYETGSLPQAMPDWESIARQLDQPAKKANAWWYYAGAAAIVGAIVMITRMALPPATAPTITYGKSNGPGHAAQAIAVADSINNVTPATITATLPALRHTVLPRKAAMPPKAVPENNFPEDFQEQASIPVKEVASVAISVARNNSYANLLGSDETAIPLKRPKPSLNLIGGVQSGSLHTGYTVGFTVQQGIGKRFYVGGSVAVVSAVAQQSLTLSASGYQAFTAAGNGTLNGIGGGFTPTNAPANNNLYYLQVAPTVRYSITKKLLLATGPDYQHLLQDASSKTLVYKDDKAQLAPANDFGWNSGLDYAITGHLQCGFRYRTGINNLLQPTAGQLNRNYLQAHLSLKLTRW